MGQELQRAVEAVERLEQAPDAALNTYLVARLERLLSHAAGTSPHYRQSLASAGWRPGSVLTPERWRRIPLLERRLLQDRPAQLEARELPEVSGPAQWVHSSGSTGMAIRVRVTRQQSGLWDAITIREHREHRRDSAASLAVIRVVHGELGQPPQGSELADWGKPVNRLHRTGPSALLSIDADSRTQARWLARHDPGYLLTYPSNLAAVMDALAHEGLGLPALQQVRTVNESLGDGLRERCRDELGVELADVYSASEVGYIATQTPDLERYRCRNETVLVELLDDDGAPVAPGQPGRVVVTALYSFAMPVIRYAIGDVAVAGDQALWCGAPRYLERILGRQRNLLVLPDGSRRWPRLGLRRMNAMVALRQVQAIQTALDAMTLKVVCDEPLPADARAALEQHITGRFATITRVNVEQVAEIPRGAGGKFEEFLSQV